MLTVRQAAQRACVCPSIVYGWVATKVLAHFRLGAPGKRGKIVISEQDLDAFLQSQRVGPERLKAVPAPPQPPQRLRLKNLRLG
jgi:hypothetical protein